MDILNWLYLAKNKFVRTTPSSDKDLMVFGAKVGTSKRGDLYQNYAMSAEDFIASFKNPQFISTADGTVVTGTTSATKSTSVLIPANTVAPGDSIFVRVRARKPSAAAATSMFVSVNSANGYGGNNVAVVTLGTNGLYGQLSRTLVVKPNASTEVIFYGGGAVDDDAVTSLPVSTYNINWAQDQYFVFSFLNFTTGESAVISYYEITVNKQ
jgi:hypothetical protein